MYVFSAGLKGGQKKNTKMDTPEGKHRPHMTKSGLRQPTMRNKRKDTDADVLKDSPGPLTMRNRRKEADADVLKHSLKHSLWLFTMWREG